MKIKNIFSVGLVCCAFAALSTSCSKDEEAFYTVSENDSPRILNTDFPDGGFSINRDANLKFEVLVTPADYTTVKWYADGKEEYVGNTIDKAFEAGEYTLKILAVTTQGKETSRTMSLKVKPLADDPVAEEKVAERLQSPGAAAKVSGSNLSKITAVSVNGIVAKVTSNADNYIEYIVPDGLADGQYRISLIDGENNSFGGGRITITSNATVSKTDFSAKSGGKLELPGCKLSDVQTVTINGLDCGIVSKEDAKVVVNVPELEEGTYEVKATTISGGKVKFLGDDGLVEVASVKITLIPETILWEGKHEVDWGTIWEDKDGTVTAQIVENANVGSKLRLYCKRTASDYCQVSPTVNWANLITGLSDPDRGDKPFEGEATMEFALTAKSFELFKQGNLQVVGHGFDLLKITIE